MKFLANYKFTLHRYKIPLLVYSLITLLATIIVGAAQGDGSITVDTISLLFIFILTILMKDTINFGILNAVSRKNIYLSNKLGNITMIFIVLIPLLIGQIVIVNLDIGTSLLPSMDMITGYDYNLTYFLKIVFYFLMFSLLISSLGELLGVVNNKLNTTSAMLIFYSCLLSIPLIVFPIVNFVILDGKLFYYIGKILSSMVNLSIFTSVIYIGISVTAYILIKKMDIK